MIWLPVITYIFILQLFLNIKFKNCIFSDENFFLKFVLAFFYCCRRMRQPGPQKQREDIGFGKKDENLPPKSALGT